MDTDQTSKVKIDLSKLDQSWVDGQGDAFSIPSDQWNTLNVSGGSLAPGYGAVPPVPAITWPNSSPSWTFSDLSITSPPQAKIELRGEDADIEINGDSVVGMLREIRDRLNILQVSEEMEAEWDDLRELREQYEAKLAECREKSRAWAALKQAG